MYFDKELSKKITSNSVEIVPGLAPGQFEDDCRIFSLVFYADSIFRDVENSKVIIYSVDTDVTVLAIYHFSYFLNISELWIEKRVNTSKVNTYGFVPIHEICKKKTQIFQKYCRFYTL